MLFSEGERDIERIDASHAIENVVFEKNIHYP